jgi:aldose 1-epimerase
MSGLRHFGRLGETDILEVTLATQAGAEARIITWGAVLRDLVVPGRDGPRRVVLGLDRLEDYLRYSRNFGAIVGRVANRIGQARFRLGGEEISLVPNENGNQLHGGPLGFGKVPWSLVAHTTTSAHLALVSENGDMGFPGRLFATCTYELREPATLVITLQAFADQPTPVNLTAHNYFNLDGSPDTREHELLVHAGFYTPTDAALIPTGEIASVGGTPFDFRSARALSATPEYLPLDINLVLSRDQGPGQVLAHAATLAAPASGLAMELWTTEPGLQVYDGHKVDLPIQAASGMPLRPYCGIALEPQRFPGAPNHAHFGQGLLEPGRVSRQASEFRFVVRP